MSTKSNVVKIPQYERVNNLRDSKSSTINQNRGTKESHKLSALSTHVQTFLNIKWSPIMVQRKR